MYKEIILASGSPRRSELLTQIGIEFKVEVSQVDEVYTSTEPEEIVKELALLKASDIARNHHEDTVVIGADTIVVQDNQILGKPCDRAHAIEMIDHLQGKVHMVYTGVAIIKGNKKVVKAIGTKVYVNPMTPAEIEAYVDTKEPMDKAGGYGIQGKFAAFIEKIDGDYYNVVGLPISYVYKKLTEF